LIVGAGLAPEDCAIFQKFSSFIGRISF